ncbi:hypothetical protein NQ314_000902 [Rhamnusium bicolor]|uniref:Uncharacterized protein n=1 Tax=Rhamnusium bicolor TaxID=1586634 RepID=A0AAV8ZT91_9CUCU|nr:hypothetical protein NQ314_000902 [Rhamnusium bicolor]
MPDFSKTIDTLDGQRGPTAEKQWLEKLGSTARLQPIRDWTSFKNAFTKTFVFSESKTDLCKTMYACVRKTKDVSIYFHEKVALC